MRRSSGADGGHSVRRTYGARRVLVFALLVAGCSLARPAFAGAFRDSGLQWLLADLEARPTDATNYQIRLSYARLIQRELSRRGEDVSLYTTIYQSRGMAELGAGDWPAFYLTVHRYTAAVTRHLLYGHLSLGTPISTGAAHPHLFFDAAAVPGLRTPASAGHQDMLDVNAFSVAQIAVAPPKTYAELSSQEGIEPWRIYGNNLIELAFRAMITQSPADVALAKSWLMTIVDYPHWGVGEPVPGETFVDLDFGLPAAHLLLGTAVAYDWLYNDLTPQERCRVRTKLANTATIVHTYAAGYVDIWWRDAPEQNHNPIKIAGLAMAGYALRGEIEQAEEWIAHGLANTQMIMDHRESVLDGSYQEGVSYWSYAMSFFLAHLNAIAFNGGPDFAASSTWLEQTMLWRLYCQHPDYQTVVSYADGAPLDYHGPHHILRRLDAEYRTGYGEWLTQQLISGFGPTHFERRAWIPFEYLWYDPTVTPTPPTDLPLSRWFSDLDLLILRSGWDAGDTVLTLRAGRPGGRARFNAVQSGLVGRNTVHGGHTHADAAALSVNAFGADLLHGPGYPTVKATYWNSTFLVNGAGQVGEGHFSFDRDDEVLALNAYGQVVELESVPAYDYAKIAAGPAYPSATGIQRGDRHVLFLKPNIVLTVDQVDFASAVPVTEMWRRYDTAFLSQGQKIATQAPNGAVLWLDVLQPTGVTITPGLDMVDFVSDILNYPPIPFYHAQVAPPAPSAVNRFVTLLTMRPGAINPASGQISLNGTDTTAAVIRDGVHTYAVAVAIAPNPAEAATVGLAGDAYVLHVEDVPGVGPVIDYFAANSTRVWDPATGRVYLESAGGPVTAGVRLSGTVAHVDSASAGDVSLYAPLATSVLVNGAPVAFTRTGDNVSVTLVP